MEKQRGEIKQVARKMEDKKRGIKLDLKLEKDRKMRFLEVEIMRHWSWYQYKWYQKKCNVRISCNKKSDVDEIKKAIFIQNMEKKIETLTNTAEEKEE